MMRPTFHLVPAAVWAATAPNSAYLPESLASEGFVHCTDGEGELLATANRHYRLDPRPFLVLTLDLELIHARWTVEDPSAIYPHIHGPVDWRSIIDVRPLSRAADGRFVAIVSEPIA
ncbi:MAG: DUF952 domain-containing protein [Candidatus Limnocylindrales bacterium]